jgi:hypothetical protein
MEHNEFDRIQRQGFEEQLTIAGEWREIVTQFGSGGNFTRKCKVIWSTEALKQMPMAGQDGVYYEGDVLLTVRVKDLNAIPKPGLLLQSPVGMSYRILDVIEDYGCYAIKLVRNW